MTDADKNAFQLRRALGSLPRSRAPERDLWPGIAARLAANRRRPYSHRWSIAAGFAAAATLAAVAVWQWPLAPESGQPTWTQRPASQAQTTAALERSYAAAAHAMRPAAGRSLQRLDPGTRAVVVAEFEQMEDAAERLRRALAESPNKGYLAHLLAQTRRRQLELLRELPHRNT